VKPFAIFRAAIIPAIAFNLFVLVLLRDQLAGLADFQLHAPDWALLARQGFMIQLHLAAAVSALAVAILMLSRPKGTRMHRVVGWVWVVLMMTTALSSFFIRELNGGSLSAIHILSGWTALAAPLAVWAARTRRIKLHARFMTGIVIGGLFIAGALSFMPGRLMWRVFF
jgi:uncharacterized membrane protein